MSPSAARRLAAEFTGTAFLLLAIVGSGITASADGPASGQLFQHALAVGAALGALIVTFAHVSGAHFNPAVTLAQAVLREMPARTAAAYAVVQVAGAVAGTVVANLLFSLPAVALATTERAGLALAASEGVATFGLVVVVAGTVRAGRAAAVPVAVGAYIAAAIYATPSASFANPAVTLARVLSDTYTGIHPVAIPGFLAAQLGGALVAAAFAAWLFRRGGPARGAPHGVDDEKAGASR